MSIDHPQQLLQQALTQNNFSVTDQIQQRLLQYLELLQKWNRVFNLTSIDKMPDMIFLHVIDSLVISPFLHGVRILDVGTGAGLPGIPLALTHPEKQFFLLDSNSKKTRFLTQVVHELHISNVEVIHSRVENFHPSGCFDSILSRAFATLKNMLTQTRHLLCRNGQFLAMKGVYPEHEIQEIIEEYQVLATHRLRIIGLEVERHLVCVVQ